VWPYERWGGRDSDLAEHVDLYGPTMCVLTLGCIVVYSMQLAHQVRGLFVCSCLDCACDRSLVTNMTERLGQHVKGGTVIGTSLAMCFSYWGLTSALFYGAAKLSDTLLSLLSIVSVVGYGFFGLCCGFTGESKRLFVESPWSSLSANASGFDTHRDLISSRFDCSGAALTVRVAGQLRHPSM
jgi:hypothetical protein